MIHPAKKVKPAIFIILFPLMQSTMEAINEIIATIGKNKSPAGGTHGPPGPVLAKTTDKPNIAVISTIPIIIPVKTGFLKALITLQLISLLYKPPVYLPHRVLSKN